MTSDRDGSQIPDQKEYSLRMLPLLSALARQRNGVVSEQMEARGVRYPLNYGVSLPDIREIAGSQHRDMGFAEYLFRQQVRELRIAALMLAVPEELSMERLDFWLSRLDNTEMAELFSAFLLSRADAVMPQAVRLMLDSSERLLRYSAILCVTRRFEVFGNNVCSGIAAQYGNCGDRLLESAADSLMTVMG